MNRIRYGPRPEEELRNRELEATSVGAWATTLTAVYETDPEVIAAVLPPPLEPPAEPLARITIASVDIEGLPTFGAATVAVGARHEGTVGDYALVMPMTTEQSVIGGRETYQIALERDGYGQLHWHCTCADHVYRCETTANHACKHIRGLRDFVPAFPSPTELTKAA